VKDEMTTITFMIYGPYSERDNKIINHAVLATFDNKIYYQQVIEELDEGDAELFNVCRGWSVQWQFKGRVDYKSLCLLISEGLDFLRLKHEVYGVVQDVHYAAI